jgi:Kdo2-lipid IVA lauroyltransferase/acyltransferase
VHPQPIRPQPRTMALALMRLAARAPLAVLHAIGVALGWIAYCSRTYRRDVRRNLALAGYEGDSRLRRAAIGEAGKMIAEAPKILLDAREKTLALVRAFDGREHIDRARAAGQGIVYLTPHFGCFEIAGQAIAEIGPLTALYRPAKIAWLRPVIEQGRIGGPNRRVAPADLRGVRILLGALKRGEAVIVLPDQVPGRGEGVWAEFFGEPAYTMTLAARLAERKDSVCLIVTGERLPRGAGFVLHVRPLPAPLPGESTARRINRALEEAIRARPEQYLWGYNRYKRPRGAEPPRA